MTRRRWGWTTILVAAAWVVAPGCGGDPAEAVQSDDQATRIEALRALGKQGDERALEVAARMIEHEDVRTAREAVRAVGRARSGRAVNVLEEAAASDARPDVRREVVIQLAHRSEPETRAALKRRIEEETDPRARARAIAALARFEDLADVALFVQLAERVTDTMVQSAAVRAAEEMIKMKVGYDPDDPPAVRAAAVRRLRYWALERVVPQMMEREAKGGLP